MTNHDERGRVPRALAGNLVGVAALLAGAANLFTLTSSNWPQASRSDSLTLALWSTVITLIASIVLVVLAGLAAHIENILANMRYQYDPELELRLKERLDHNTGAYYGCIATILASLGATVVFTGGAARSPFAQILVGSFILGQVLSPNRRNVWFLFFSATVTVIGCHAIYEALSRVFWPAGFVGLEIPAWSHILPTLLTALTSTFVNLASVRYRQALAASTTLKNITTESPNQPSGDETPKAP